MALTVYFENNVTKTYDCKGWTTFGSFLAIYNGPGKTVLIPEHRIRLVEWGDKQ